MEISQVCKVFSFRCWSFSRFQSASSKVSSLFLLQKANPEGFAKARQLSPYSWLQLSVFLSAGRREWYLDIACMLCPMPIPLGSQVCEAYLGCLLGKGLWNSLEGGKPQIRKTTRNGQGYWLSGWHLGHKGQAGARNWCRVAPSFLWMLPPIHFCHRQHRGLVIGEGKNKKDPKCQNLNGTYV